MSQSIKKNFAYKSALTLSNYLISFVTFPYVSRVLGVERLGLVNFVDNTVSYFLLFATMGIALLGVREIAAVRDDEIKRSKVFCYLLGMNLRFTLFTLLVYFACISFVPKLNQYEDLFYIGGAKIISTAFLVEWFFTGMENFRYITLRALTIKTLYVISVFVFVQNADDYRLYFILTVSVVVVNALINMVYIRRFIFLRLRDFLGVHYLKPYFTLGIYAIMTSMYQTFNVMYLGLVSNNTEVGYYTTAFKLYVVVLGLFSAFTNVMLPRMSALLANGEKEKFQQLINKSFTIVLRFSIPVIFCSIILAPQIIYILSGHGYEGAISPMRIIMPAVLLVGIAQVLAVQILMPMKKDRVLLYASIIGAIVSLMINIWVVPSLQSVGSALVMISAEFVVTSTYLLYVHSQHIMALNILSKFCESVCYALPCAVICIACIAYISNVFLSLFVAITASAICWIILQKVTKKAFCFVRSSCN